MPSVLIAAASGRALAASARRAGYAPVVADFFGDEDTIEAARAHVRLPDGLSRGMDDTLLDALASLAADEESCGVVWGTGFEDRPHLLAKIARRWPLIGKHAGDRRAIKDPLCAQRACARTAAFRIRKHRAPARRMSAVGSGSASAAPAAAISGPPAITMS